MTSALRESGLLGTFAAAWISRREVGNGSVSRAARQAQAELLSPAAIDGRPRTTRSKWDRDKQAF